MLKDNTILNPNFSIVTPGGCNAQCGFCFWQKTKAIDNYILRLENILDSLPEQFEQLSITGGEPTMSPYFSEILKVVSKRRNKFKKVVLTTNGFNLLDFTSELEGIVDHVNISRHSVNDSRNCKIFKTNTVPSSRELPLLCQELNNVGIDVTFSTVLVDSEYFSIHEIINFIDFAKEHGASQVFFRIEHGSIDEHPIEKQFAHVKYKEHNCGVCRNREQLIKGMKVIWKASVLEPSNDLGSTIYEAIYHADGKLTKDWEGENEIKFSSLGIDALNMLNDMLDEALENETKESLVEFLETQRKSEQITGCGIRMTSSCGSNAFIPSSSCGSPSMSSCGSEAFIQKPISGCGEPFYGCGSNPSVKPSRVTGCGSSIRGC